MAIVLFILIAGLWAAFLLPSFFDHRKRNPRSTTRDFARTKQLLATVSASRPDTEAYVRRHTQIRRTRVLVVLGVGALLTLVVATWTGSIAWLWAAVAFDVAIAGYVTLLLTMKRQSAMPHAQVVPITAVSAEPTAAAGDTAEGDMESKTVRVVAG
jgi:hypothetical protein